MVPGFGRLMQLLSNGAHQFRGLAVYVRDGFSEYRQGSYECGGCEVRVVRICSNSHNLYVFGVYRNPDLLDKIFRMFVGV